MVARIVLVVVLVACTAVVAAILDRRRRAAPPSQGRAVVPHQLDRNDFPRPEAQWLVVLWSSRNCDSCQGLREKLTPLESADVAVVEVEYQTEPDLHRRYRIEAAPISMVVDSRGVTQASFTGAFEASELWGVLAALRDAQLP